MSSFDPNKEFQVAADESFDPEAPFEISEASDVQVTQPSGGNTVLGIVEGLAPGAENLQDPLLNLASAGVEQGIAGIDKLSGGRIGSLLRGDGFNPGSTEPADRVLATDPEALALETNQLAAEASQTPEFLKAESYTEGGKQVVASFNPAVGIGQALTDNGLKGAAIETGAQLIGFGLGKALAKPLSFVGAKLAKVAPRKILSKVDDIIIKDNRKLLGLERESAANAFSKGGRQGNKIVQTVTDRFEKLGVFKGAKTSQEVQERILGLEAGVEQNLKVLSEGVDKIFPKGIKFTKLKERLTQKVLKNLESTSRLNNSQIKRVIDVIEDASDNAVEGRLTMGFLNRLRTAVGKKAFKPTGEVGDDVMMSVWKELRNFTDSIYNKIPGDIGKTLKSNNQLYSDIKNVKPFLQRAVNSETSAASGFNIIRNKSDLIQAVVPTTRGAAELGQKTLQSPVTQSVLKNISRFGRFSKVLSEAADKGTRPLAVTIHTLSATDAEFRKRLREVQEKEDVK